VNGVWPLILIIWFGFEVVDRLNIVVLRTMDIANFATGIFPARSLESGIDTRQVFKQFAKPWGTDTAGHNVVTT
jgi:hypothetical protein